MTGEDGSTFQAISAAENLSSASSVLWTSARAYLLTSNVTAYADASDSDTFFPEGAISTMPEEAEALGSALMEAIGLDVTLAGIRCIQSSSYSQDPFTGDILEENEDTYGYKLTYLRIVDGITIASHSVSSSSGDAVVWNWEEITLYIDDDGIVSFNWYYPLNILEQVSENVGILSFQEAAETFEEMAPIYFSPSAATADTQRTAEVTKIELCLMRVRDSGSERTGELVPAWVFYGNMNLHYTGTDAGTGEEYSWDDTYEQPYILLAVNAVDGSLISTVDGY